MTNIVEQLFKSLDPWPGFQITSFKIQVSPVDGRKTLILDLRPVEGSMPICSRCRHEAPLVHSYVSRRIKECSPELPAEITLKPYGDPRNVMISR